ncbi:SET domain-containing protein 4 [Achroia grisella]|uniref:SET domain-containing protein 4 n=1 Tax=Achroia grisella TaxID=688607 RepID=UPI0027D2A881|nr:SET domain-containing protein 4 [Achroia grisella]
MGRTQRKRNRNKMRNFRTCDDCKEIVFFNSWLAKQGMRRNNKLTLAVFDDTGRGVLTKKKIKPGEELMNLPLNLTINVTTILMDLNFCNIFLENTKHCLQQYKNSVTFQSLMALYLTYLKVQGSKSEWFLYLESLPNEYTTPYFLRGDILNHVDTDILAVISKQKDIINSSYYIFEEILNNTTSNDVIVKELKECFTMSIYEWAYFTVNTRCVFMDLTKVIDLKNVQTSILNIICDNTKISLCPYLDMINHSPIARNETKLVVSRNIENIRVANLNHVLFADVWFSIFTKNIFEPYTQVFICYGDSHNLKLITEYGFYLPNNELDYVSFTFESVDTFLRSQGIKLSNDQNIFINSHGLNKDLYIDLKGLSYNFYGLLMVVKYYYNKTVDVGRLLYSAAICSSNRDLNDIITPMVRDKLIKLKESVSKLETYENQCVITSNCIALMCQYVVILEKFIKC